MSEKRMGETEHAPLHGALWVTGMLATEAVAQWLIRSGRAMTWWNLKQW